MKRRSFLGGLLALPFFGGVAVARYKHTAGVSPEWGKEPIDVIFVGEYPNGEWIKDPFIPVNLDNGAVAIGDISFHPDYLIVNRETIKKVRDILNSNSSGTVELIWGPDTEFVERVDIRYNESFGHMIPLEDKIFDKGEFYTKVTKNAPDQRLEFYHITHKGKNNLFVRTFETTRRDSLFISKEAMEDILNWTY